MCDFPAAMEERTTSTWRQVGAAVVGSAVGVAAGWVIGGRTAESATKGIVVGAFVGWTADRHRGRPIETVEKAVGCTNRCGKAGTRQCRGCDAVWYCSVECQRIHWENGGHMSVCKETRTRIVGSAVATAPAPPMHTRVPGNATDWSGCIICLDTGNPPPIQSGCACRGDAGLAHVNCRVEAATAGSPRDWCFCGTCGQQFSGSMIIGLTKARWSAFQGLDAESSGDEQLAALNLAEAWCMEKRFSESEALCREVRGMQQRAITPTLEVVTASTSVLGTVLMSQCKFTDAEALAREAVTYCRQEYGPEHSCTLKEMEHLGSALRGQLRFTEALVVYEEMLEISQRVQDPFANIFPIQVHKATALCGIGEHAEAEATVREILAVQHRVLGPDHPAILQISLVLCTTLILQGKMTEATLRCRDLLASRMRLLGARHPDTASVSNTLAYCRRLRKAKLKMRILATVKPMLHLWHFSRHIVTTSLE